MRRANLVLLGLFSLILFGCSGVDVGAEKTVDTSGSKPEWLAVSSTEKDELVLITGEVTQANDRSFGMNQAYADGMRKLMNMMQNNVKTQSSQVMQGNNMTEGDIGKFSEFSIAWVSDTRNIMGVKNPESYWEKVEKKTMNGVTYYYNCYTLLTLTKTDYNKILEGAYSDMKKRAQSENNKKAEDTANQLLNELKK